jgi:TPR repeat protein
MYGLILSEGRGIPMDKSLAVHYHKFSADQGHSLAQSRYAFMLDEGEGIAMDKELSASYFHLSAAQGDGVAQ